MKRIPAIVLLAVVCLLLLYGFLAFTQLSVASAMSDLIHGSLGGSSQISQTFQHATPLLVAAVAVFVALRAGLFNIGVEGQFVIGALATGFIGTKLSGGLGMTVAIFGGAAMGALWSFPAGWIKAYKGGHEVITTIMLNSVAGYIAVGLASGPIKQAGQESPQTAKILATMPSIPMGGLSISWATLIAFFLPLLAGLWFSRSVKGFETDATGANIHAARQAGINTKRVIVRTMVVSGAIAGLAGALQVVAYSHRFYPDISSGTGFDALGVALLAGSYSWVLIPAAFAFGMLYQASPLLQIDGLPKGIVDILLAIMIIVGAAIRFRRLKALG